MKIRRLTRRDFVASLAAATVLPACGSSSGDGTGNSGGAGGVGTGGMGGSGMGGSGTGGSGGAPSTGPGPEPAMPWEAPGTEDATAFAWGVQTGDATPSSVLVSARTLEAGVTLTVMRGIDGGWEEVSSGDAFTPEDGVVQLELQDLAADTTYALAFFSSDGSRRSRVGRFRTALAAGASRVIRFGSTSCLGGSNSPWPSLSQSPPEKLDFMCLLGDTIYADNSPDQFDYEQKYMTALETAGLQDATAGTSIIATWDDHEIDNNWSYDFVDQAQFDEAISRFRQGLPQRVGPGGTGIWRQLSWGSAMDVFVLDCRGERRDGNYISVEQMNWLKDALSASQATFKVILNSVPIFDFSTTIVGSLLAEDRWQGFPAQRTEIVSHVRNGGITGVFWVTGDFHVAGIGRIDADGGPGDDQWEVLTGPGGSGVNALANAIGEDDRVRAIVTAWNYTLFEADPAAGTMRVRFVGDMGETIREEMLQVI